MSLQGPRECFKFNCNIGLVLESRDESISELVVSGISDTQGVNMNPLQDMVQDMVTYMKTKNKLPIII